MGRIMILRGLPASGKSSFAREYIKNNANWKRINKDDLRAMLDNSKHSKGNENFILEARDLLIRRALAEGYNVIVDDTNFNPKHITAIEAIALEYGATVEVNDSFLEVSVEECIERDLKRSRSVGEKVIRRMYNEYLKESQQVPEVKYDPSLPDCYIFDIDGTLAIMGDRGPYDWHRVGEDNVNTNVARTLEMLRTGNPYDSSRKPVKIIVFSGRDSICVSETAEWLASNGIKFDELVMRNQGDNRKDVIVKREMFESHIRGKYNVLGIFDDRNQVVEMWRNLGLTCYQVAEGDF